MKLTIIKSDSFVSVDGEVLNSTLDFSDCNLPSNVHALQWFDTRGWIEFTEADAFSPKLANEEITELPSWAISVKNVFDKAKEELLSQQINVTVLE